MKLTRNFMVLALLVVSTGCSSLQQAPKEYTKATEDAFIRGCESTSGGRAELCKCLFEKIKVKYTYEEFTTLERKIKSGEKSEEFNNFMKQASSECGN